MRGWPFPPPCYSAHGCCRIFTFFSCGHCLAWTGPGPGGCGQITQQAAEDLYRKAQANKTNFVAELTGSGAVSAADLADTVAATVGAPLIDLAAVDPLRLPKDLLDPKICQTYRVLALAKRGNRVVVATADPSLQEAAEKIKFTTQLGVDWVIAEYDKLSKLDRCQHQKQKRVHGRAHQRRVVATLSLGTWGGRKPLKRMKPRPRAT